MTLPLPDALLLTMMVTAAAWLLLGDLSYFRGPRAEHAARPAAKPGAARVRVAAPPPVAAPVADLLLVDDSAVARAKLRRMFEAAGYRVHLANDGVEASALLEQGAYAMMITDLEMPNMDGVALINECLRQPQTRRMPIIAISAHENLRVKFNECRDIAGVHRKPWVDDILLSHVATLIGTRRVHQAELPASAMA